MEYVPKNEITKIQVKWITYSSCMQELTALSHEFFRASSAVTLFAGSKMSILSRRHKAPDGKLHRTIVTLLIFNMYGIHVIRILPL